MKRHNGGIVGKINATSQSSSKGRFTLPEVQEAKLNNTWPLQLVSVGFLVVAGGGGGGSAGTNASNSSGAGGNGVASSITGSSVTRAKGGTGNADVAGGTNTGDGAGGGNSVARNGGSGVVIIKIPDTYTATFSAGVTQTSSTSGGFKVYTVTATSTTSETVTFS